MKFSESRKVRIARHEYATVLNGKRSQMGVRHKIP